LITNLFQTFAYFNNIVTRLILHHNSAQYHKTLPPSISFSVLSVLTTPIPAFAVDFTEILIDSNQPSQHWMKEIADIDNDGKPDLIVCGRSGPVVWYKNPTWNKTVINTNIGGTGSTTGIESGDIDGDGILDAVKRNQGRNGDIIRLLRQHPINAWTERQGW